MAGVGVARGGAMGEPARRPRWPSVQPQRSAARLRPRASCEEMRRYRRPQCGDMGAQYSCRLERTRELERR